MPSVTMNGTEMVTVVVDLTNTVVGTPPMVTVESAPYSSEVV